ncbi:MAG: AMP-binding protein, partial [Polyangiaceae bacterium]|nr:AMP-binding protein [Polyangiaceae bacterium]
LDFTIVRPAIVESTIEYPFPGWNEGINTSAPIMFLVRQGGLQVPGSDNNLDMIPCDMVCAGIILALSELLDGSQRPVYQAGSSDVNPCSMARFFELSGLHKRRHHTETGKGSPIVNKLQRHFEGGLLNKKEYESYGPKRLARGASSLSRLIRSSAKGPLAPLKGASQGLDAFAKTQAKLGRIMDIFLPFICEFNYIFKTDAIYAAYGRLSEKERSLLPWYPEKINWREWFMEIHAPALERHVFPEMERRLEREKVPPRAHQTLTHLLNDMVSRHDLRPALQLMERDGLSKWSYRELGRLSRQTAARLQAVGVERGDRVLLAGNNHPGWPISFFGILSAGATVVPFDPALEEEAVHSILEASRSKAAILDTRVQKQLSLGTALPVLDLETQAERDHSGAELELEAESDALAALIYTSGTTGTPKGVMLSHENFTSLISSLAPLFPLGTGDRLLSVLPLHHTFELSCGLLLPLSRGARIAYLDELNADRLKEGLAETRATALIGVPALWEMIERSIHCNIEEKGRWAPSAFRLAQAVSQMVGKSTGIDIGKGLFGQVHEGLGGHLRYLVSGGAALHPDTHRLFQSLGLHLAEGYGLTEAAPVLTVAQGGPQSRSGHVGHAVPGVELRIENPGEDGIGEVLAKGPNIMRGYSDNAEATNDVLQDGWLRTGDLGKLDRRGRLTLVGRQKDVVVTSNGENIYPDDIEERLGSLNGIEEYSILGVDDGRGGELLAAAVIPALDDARPRDEKHQHVRRVFKEACAGLPRLSQPSIVVVLDQKLPRTSTRKVKRPEVRRLVEHAGVARQDARRDQSPSQLEKLVVEQVALIARRSSTQVQLSSDLRAELGFDSLMGLELLVGLETRLGRALDGEKLAAAETVRELVDALKLTMASLPSRTTKIEGREEKKDLKIPAPLRDWTKSFLGAGQLDAYRRIFTTNVTGRASIPHNRNTLVVANHSSHLDMGLVKYALGDYGKDLITLAAQDYFFEGDRYRKAYFDQLTNLVPMPRSGSLRAALRRAGEVLDRGHTVLIFPEGSRGDDARLRPFKPAMGHIALHHQVDILPIWLEGTHRALPRGSKFPRNRHLGARIGQPISISRLSQLTANLNRSDASRVVARIAYLAVDALSKSEAFELEKVDIMAIVKEEAPVELGLAPLMDELRQRFQPDVVESPLSYYFSLGEERWTVRVTSAEVEVAKGKTVDNADCVLKTDAQTFEKIIRESWVPGPKDFMAGRIKTNNINHLMKMQKLFQLNIKSEELGAAAGEPG